MNSTPLRIAIGVITYGRPAGLDALLAGIAAQQDGAEAATGVGWHLTVVVVDNDAAGSARSVAERWAQRIPLRYLIEPEPGIPAARRRCVQAAVEQGVDALIFVDDDEIVPPNWVSTLVACWRASGADVVTAPVRGLLPPTAPRWARHSDAFHRPGRLTGTRLPSAYTGNTLVSRRVLCAIQPSFDDRFRFTGSSDLHYFLKVVRAGFVIVWCEEAAISETVPAERISLGWLLRRAYRSGAGDTIARRMIDPGPRAAAMGVVRGGGRALSGVAYLCGGALVARPDWRIKGVRRVASGAGSIGGVVGHNYAEYARSHLQSGARHHSGAT